MEVFRFPATGQQVRTFLRGDLPWFVTADALAVLSLSRSSVALLDDDEKGVHTVDTPGGDQQVSVINEPGLYSLILRSRRPEAKAFKRWVTHEVLPAIRQNGRYEISQRFEIPQTYADALELAARQAREIDQQKEKLAITAPKAEAWDVLAGAEGDYAVREAAHILNRDPAINTGQNRLFKLLRQWGLIDKRNVPYASHAHHVRLRAVPYLDRSTGEEQTGQQVRLTVECIRYLHRRMGGTTPLTLHSPHGPAEPAPLPSGSAGPQSGGSG